MSRSRDDALDRLLDIFVVDADCETHLLVKRHLLDGTTIALDEAGLLTAPHGRCDGEFKDSAGVQLLLDGIQPLGLNVGDN